MAIDARLDKRLAGSAIGWAAGGGVVCLFMAITWLGILLVHPVMRRMLHGDKPSNELIIHIAGSFALVYASFLVC